MLTFVHCADFHLGSPFAGERAAVRDEKRRMMLSSFIALINKIKTEEIPLALISGDLFDSPDPSPELVSAVLENMRSADGCRFFICAGNHDPYKEGGVWDGDMPDNVHVFKNTQIESMALPGLGVRVYGWSLCESSAPTDPLDGFIPESDGLLPIAMGHANLSGSEDGVNTLHERSIVKSGFAYLALGHIHARSEYKAGNTVYGYSGCACGRDFGECGQKGYLTVTCGEGLTQSTFCPLEGQRYYRETLDVTGCADSSDVTERVKGLCAGKSIRISDCLRLTLTGSLSSEVRLDLAIITASCGMEYLALTDDTSPTADTEALRADPGLRGEVFRLLEKELGSGDPDTSSRAVLALKFALAAMAGDDLGAIGEAGEAE